MIRHQHLGALRLATKDDLEYPLVVIVAPSHISVFKRSDHPRRGDRHLPTRANLVLQQT
jgi:hypothetical protein